MKWVMALATRVECDEESDGFVGGKSDGNESGRRLMIDGDKGNGDGDGDDMVDGDGDKAGG
jgi:hypothetical protein